MTLRKIDGYALDCILEEQATYDAEVTEYPIESGGKASDHVENATPVVTMTFIVSDTPTGEVAAVRSANAVPSSEAKRFLLDLRDARRPFTVEGTTGTYPLMVFKSLTESRDKDTGDALVIEAEFRQLRLEEVRRAVVDGPVNLGHRPSRSAKGPTMCICPDVSTTSFDDRANKAKKCREVEEKKGRLYYVDTGEEVGLGAAVRAKPCPKGTEEIVLRDGDLVYDPDRGGWVNRTQFGDGRAVDAPLTPAQTKALPALEDLRGKGLVFQDDFFGGSALPNGLDGKQSIFR